MGSIKAPGTCYTPSSPSSPTPFQLNLCIRIPLERGREIAAAFGVAPLLSPLFDFTPSTNALASMPAQHLSGTGATSPSSASASYSSLGPSGSFSANNIPQSLPPPPIMPGSALRLLNQGRAQGLFTPSTSGKFFFLLLLLLQHPQSPPTPTPTLRFGANLVFPAFLHPTAAGRRRQCVLEAPSLRGRRCSWALDPALIADELLRVVVLPVPPLLRPPAAPRAAPRRRVSQQQHLLFLLLARRVCFCVRAPAHRS